MSYFGLDKIMKFVRMVRENGGIRASYMKLYRMDDIKTGRLVGTDKYGNKYFENPYYFVGRSRWVEYAPHVNTDYDGSQIPADWYGWMHYKSDDPPVGATPRERHAWMHDHSENLSGTKNQYAPYSTTRAKIEPWVPQSK